VRNKATKITDQELVKKAREVAQRSYSPYSGVRVGAALEADGQVFVGTNVENSSYGLTICAERAAVLAAIAAGARHLERIAVACNREEPLRPCGACLQVLAEFARELKVLLAGSDGDFITTSLAELLPHPFKLNK
jgi:cytidine deaminase